MLDDSDDEIDRENALDENELAPGEDANDDLFKVAQGNEDEERERVARIDA